MEGERLEMIFPYVYGPNKCRRNIDKNYHLCRRSTRRKTIAVLLVTDQNAL